MPKKVDKIFAKQPLNPRGRGLDPPGPLGPSRPSRYFGLPMMNSSIRPLPPNRPYHRPLNYPEYVKNFDPNAHVKFFKATIRTNGGIDNVEIINLFSFTLRDNLSIV
jgi:hypothetical protein